MSLRLAYEDKIIKFFESKKGESAIMRKFSSEYSDLVVKVAGGISRGETSVRGIGIDHATAQRIYRMMKKDKFVGSIIFYVCRKLHDEVLGKTKNALICIEELGRTLPDTEEIISKMSFETDKNILFCALMGAIIQEKDSVGMRCLDIIYRLYSEH